MSFEDIVSYFNLESNSIISELVKPLLESQSFNWSIIVIFIFGLYIISNGTNSIIITANRIYGIKNRSFAIRRIKALLMAIILIFLFLFIAIFPMLGNFLLSLIEKATGYSEIYGFINLLRWPLSFLIIFLFIKVLYILAPDKKVPSSSANIGAFVTSIGWILSTEVYLNYVEHVADYSLLFSNLANIAILMIWMYILAIIFVVGLAINYKEEPYYKNRDTAHYFLIPKYIPRLIPKKEEKKWYEE